MFMMLDDLEQNNLTGWRKKGIIFIWRCFMVHNNQILSYGKQGIH